MLLFNEYEIQFGRLLKFLEIDGDDGYIIM